MFRFGSGEALGLGSLCGLRRYCGSSLLGKEERLLVVHSPSLAGQRSAVLFGVTESPSGAQNPLRETSLEGRGPVRTGQHAERGPRAFPLGLRERAQQTPQSTVLGKGLCT